MWAFGMTRVPGGRETRIFRRNGWDQDGGSEDSGWRRVTAPTISWLAGATVISADDAWLVGPEAALHWTGASCQPVPIPRLPHANTVLRDFCPFGPDLVWAAGSVTAHVTPTQLPGQSRGIVCRWDGARWAEVALPEIRSDRWTLGGIDGCAPDDIWVVGSDAEQPILLHGDGRDWDWMPTPAIAPEHGLNHVVVLATDDVWAFGLRGVMRWDGGTWSLAQPPSEPRISIRGVVRHGSQIWVLGGVRTGRIIEPYVAELVDSAWRTLAGPVCPSGFTQTSLVSGALLPDRSGLLVCGESGIGRPPNPAAPPFVAVYRWSAAT
jgi:hypothetical protein